MANPNWKKGISGNPQGRPVGSGDRQFIRTDFWLGRFYERISKLTEEKQLEEIKYILDKFFSKIQALPSSPEDSVNNAAMQELAHMENYGTHGNGNPAPEPGSNGAHVETGTP